MVGLECSPKETSKIKSNISARQCCLACGMCTTEVHKIIVSSPQMIFFLISRRVLDMKKDTAGMMDIRETLIRCHPAFKDSPRRSLCKLSELGSDAPNKQEAGHGLTHTCWKYVLIVDLDLDPIHKEVHVLGSW